MQQLSKGHWLNTRLVDEIDEKKAELARKHGLDKESLKKKKGRPQKSLKEQGGISGSVFSEFRIGLD